MLPDLASDRLQELVNQRKGKLAHLRSAGIDPYPARTKNRITPIKKARQQFERWESKKRKTQPIASVAGRITNLRDLGKLAFIDLRDGSGTIQIMVRSNEVKEAWPIIASLDLGDFIESRGKLIRTRTGEITVGAKHITILAKSLRPPPEKFHGLHDVESRYRQRYLDLQVNNDARIVFLLRSKLVAGTP